MSANRKLAALLLGLLTGALATAARGQEVSLRIIADTNTPVPGQEEGVTFQTFFQLNGLDPGISGRNVVFTAYCPTGVYGWFDGQLRVIADLDSTLQAAHTGSTTTKNTEASRLRRLVPLGPARQHARALPTRVASMTSPRSTRHPSA